MLTAITIRELRVVRSGRPVLHRVSAHVAAGRVTGLLGPSGSGKTTLMRALVGTQVIESGEVEVLGQPAGSPGLRARVAYVTQAPAVYADLSARENLRYFARILRVPGTRVDGRALRTLADRLAKPLLGVVITHPHPDHYGGLVELVRGLDVPRFAASGVIEVARRDDAVKEEILRPMFGDEWAVARVFPDTAVADGDSVELEDIALTVTDLRSGESPHDSVWMLEGRDTVFSADLAYNRMHCYLADGFYAEWSASIERLLRELPAQATLRPGHGEACGLEALAWQRGYLETVLSAVRTADWDRPEAATAAVLDAAHEYLPTRDLEFLLELSLEPLADEVGVR